MKVAIATHVFATGPGQDLKEYFISKNIKELVFLGHPLFYSPLIKGSGYEIYKDGKLIDSRYSSNHDVYLLLKYLRSFFYSLYCGFKFVKGFDLWVGCNNLNALAGLILKKFGRVKKCVYYVIDYNPKRFPNKFINKIFHKVDQYCVKNCDETWNLSPRMAQGRKKYFGFEGGNQITVPLGVWFDRIEQQPLIESKIHSAVYVGHLLQKQGVQYIISAVPEILKSIPDFKLHVYGDGIYRNELEKLVRAFNLSTSVIFEGFVSDSQELERRISQYAITFALYNKYEPNGDLTFTYFSDPGKLKLALACGVPVLLTAVSYNVDAIVKAECGLVVTTNPAEIAKCVVDILGNQDRLKRYKINARNYAKNFNWEDIFGRLIKL